MDHEEEIKKLFGDRAFWYATSSEHADPVVLEKMRQLASPRSDWILLDVATGTGNTALYFSPFVARVIGIDITPQMLEEAEKLNSQYNIKNITFQIGNASALEFSSNSLDLVTCRRAFHHFTDISLALQEMYRVLKPTRSLIIDDRSIPDNEYVDHTMNLLDFLHYPSHMRDYGSQEWTNLLAEAGFEIESMESYVKHRPVSSLTDNAASENAQKIRDIIANISIEEKSFFDIRIIRGELFINHWFIMIKATKPA